MKSRPAIVGALLLWGLGARLSLAAETQLQLRDLREGDLLFEQSTSAQSAIIQQATHSQWTHVAIALRQKSDESISAIESAGPVGFVSINGLLARSRDGRLTVMRFHNREQTLTSENIKSLRAVLLKQLGKPYDALFLWEDDSMYCSELVWRAFKSACGVEVGKLGQWSDLDLHSPSVMAALKKRYAHDHRPLDMDKLGQTKIITPSAIYNSPLLEEVGVLQSSP